MRKEPLSFSCRGETIIDLINDCLTTLDPYRLCPDQPIELTISRGRFKELETTIRKKKEESTVDPIMKAAGLTDLLSVDVRAKVFFPRNKLIFEDKHTVATFTTKNKKK